VLFPNEPVPMMLAQMIGIVGPIDMEMLELGQETQKYFTDDYDLFTKNEVTFLFFSSLLASLFCNQIIYISQIAS